MLNFDIGEMFWGKSLSYPWWPCVIVANNKNEVRRNMRKVGTQYHVQFIGPEYDVCWITDEFLIEYEGQEQFESFMEGLLATNLSVEDKHKYDMRMSNSIQILWIKACNEAENVFMMNVTDRLAKLPRRLQEPTVLVRTAPKRGVSRGSCNESTCNTVIRYKDTVKICNGKRNSPTLSSSKLLNRECKMEFDTVTDQVERCDKEFTRKTKRSFTKATIDGNIEKETKEVVTRIKDRKTQPKKYDDDKDECHFDMSLSKELFTSDYSCLSKDIELRCFRAYLVQETKHRLENINREAHEADLEKTLKEQWSALDTDTKLLYLNDDTNYLSKSKSKSGRKIKIPSRLRRTDDVAKIKMTNSKKCQKLPPVKKRCSQSIPIISVLSMKAEEMEASYMCDSTVSLSALDRNSVDKDVIDDSLWSSLSIPECKTEMMRTVVSSAELVVNVICYYCFKRLFPEDEILACKGDCRSLYHLHCALQNKILRFDDNSLCSDCSSRETVCCVCKNSTYMNRTFLVKCPRDGCSYHFHITCVKYLTQNGNKSDDNDLVVCPNHSCLTCSREDNKHPCRLIGALASCAKCPMAYHDNFVCIPAGGRHVSKNRIVCYRHFDNNSELNHAQRLSRCFVCFNENASLKCSRCRAIFHRKCVALESCTDFPKNYVCETCRLDRPVFHGQVVWIERDSRWAPAEIINPSNLSEDVQIRHNRPLIVRDLECDKYYNPTSRELVSFETGLSLLRNVIDTNDPVIQQARIMHVLYWNWRLRLRPVTSQKFPLVAESQLLEYSLYDYQSVPQTGATYVLVYENVVNEDVQRLIPQATSGRCCCASFRGSCSDNRCTNFISQIECNYSNCSNAICSNRLFERRIHLRKGAIRVDSPTHGIVLEETLEENQLFGECTGVLMSLPEVICQMKRRQQCRPVAHVFHMLDDVYLCCGHVGNEWRHLNHSCDPNAKIVCRNVAGQLKLGVTALRSICNEEVTIDYRDSGVLLKYGFICQCQTRKCSKIIGPTFSLVSQRDQVMPRCCVATDCVSLPPAIDTPVSAAVLSRASALTEVTTVEQSIIDDSIVERMLCHICGMHGELVTCDRANCRKQYHISCIAWTARPIGIWLCPVHFCCYCGESATTFCGHCPMSCCQAHSETHAGHRCTGMDNGHVHLEVPIKKERVVRGVSNFSWLDEDSHQGDSMIRDVCTVNGGACGVGSHVIKNVWTVKAEGVEEAVPGDGGSIIINVRTVTEDMEDMEDTESLLGDDCSVVLEGGQSCASREQTELAGAMTSIVRASDCRGSVTKSVDSVTGEVIGARVDESSASHIVALSKEDLYRACDLVPFCPNADSATRHRSDSVTQDSRADDRRNYDWSTGVSNDDEYLSEKHDLDLDDVRFEIIPYRILEMEDTIISPPILDE